MFSEGNDLLELYDQGRHRLVQRYLTPGFTQHLITRQPEIDRAVRDFVDRSAIRWRDRRTTVRRSPWLAQSLGLIKLWHLRQALDSWDGITSDDERGMSILAGEHNPLRDALQQAQTLVRTWGGDLYFVYLPSWNRYANGPAAGELERRKVLSLVTGVGLPIIDLEPAFDAHHDPLSLFPFRRFGHFNEDGNRVVADAIRKVLPNVRQTGRDRSTSE